MCIWQVGLRSIRRPTNELTPFVSQTMFLIEHDHDVTSIFHIDVACNMMICLWIAITNAFTTSYFYRRAWSVSPHSFSRPIQEKSRLTSIPIARRTEMVASHPGNRCDPRFPRSWLCSRRIRIHDATRKSLFGSAAALEMVQKGRSTYQ